MSKRTSVPNERTPSTLFLSAGEEFTTAYLIPNTDLPDDFYDKIVPIIQTNNWSELSDADKKVLDEHFTRVDEWSANPGIKRWSWSGEMACNDVDITHVVQWLAFR